MTDDLFADLPDIGLVGLGMMPIGVRHPFGYGRPLLGAEDYDGQTINVRVDSGVEAILDALGARPDTSAEDERTQRLRRASSAAWRRRSSSWGRSTGRRWPRAT